MPLGRQFRDTYWNNPDTGELEQFSDRGGNAPNQGDGPVNDAQGMLFSPYHGTGMRQDPTISRQDRIAEIQRGLGLDNLDEYRQRVANNIPSQGIRRRVYEPSFPNGRTVIEPKIGTKKAQEQIDMVTESADSSDLPMSVLQEMRARTVVSPAQGRAWAQLNGGMIKLNEESYKRKVQVPGRPARPEMTAGDPIPNKSFSSMVGKIDWRSEEGANADMSGATFFDHTGNTYELNTDEHDFRWLPEGHTANVWPGSGKSTDKYIATPFKVWNGVTHHGYDAYKTFHTRHAAVPTGNMLPAEPGTETLKTVKGIDRGTLIHEMGHTLDTKSGGRFQTSRTDPMIEAVADGFADRFHRAAGNYEETLHPSEQRAAEFNKDTTHSYGMTHHVWKGRSVDKALYAAVRQHVSMGNHNYADLPDRNQIADHFGSEKGLWHLETEERQRAAQKDAHEMILGHMYDTHPHVREILGHLGLEKVGEKARSAYVERAQTISPSSPFYRKPESAGRQFVHEPMFEPVEPAKRAASPRRRRSQP